MKSARLFSNQYPERCDYAVDAQITCGIRRKSFIRRSALVTLCGGLACFFAFAVQCLAQTCPVHYPSSCTTLAQEYQGLIIERNDWQSQLNKASPDEKGAIANQIKKLLPKITAKAKELNICAAAHGKDNLPANFKGTATMTTSNPKVSGPFVANLTIDITYGRWLHDNFTIDNFSPVVVGPFDTPIGSNTTTVTLADPGVCSGVAHPTTGMLSVSVKLHFHHSLALAADSDLVITLSTEMPGGSRLKSNGAVTLVGDATFLGGYLGGDSTHLIVKGTLLPLP